MATLANKKLNYVSRLVDANLQLLEVVDRLGALKAEWDANAYAAGASPAGNNIVDGDLSGQFVYMTAAQLNTLIGAHVTTSEAVAGVRGYLEAARA